MNPVTDYGVIANHYPKYLVDASVISMFYLIIG